MKQVVFASICRSTVFAVASVFFFSGSVGAQSTVQSNPEFTYGMLEHSRDLRKVQYFLEARRDGDVAAKGFTLGGALVAISDFQQSSDDSKFAYLMRHPTSNNQIGKRVSEVVLHSFQVGMTGTINSWLAAHVSLLYDPEQSFGSGTITDLNRNQIQLRKGYVLLGDLNKSPFYFSLGKMNTPFGQTGTVNSFTNSTMWHAFGGLVYGAQFGYMKNGLEVTAMAVQGGAQFRAANTPVGDSSNVPSQVNNFVLDANFTWDLGAENTLKVGASCQHGSAYNQSFPVTHFDAGVSSNPAVTGYGRLTLGDQVVIKGGYAQTLKEWPGTHNPTPPLDVFEASKVSSKDIGVSYVFDPEADIQWAISGEFSDFRAGPEGSPWERQNQYILGYSGLFNRSSKLFVELFRTEGYSPLNFISGSDPYAPFPPGTTHSKSDVITHGIVVGAQLAF